MSAVQSSALTTSQLHDLWETLRCLHGPGEDGIDPSLMTASIKRYLETAVTGQHYARGRQGTPEGETELADLPVAVSPPGVFTPDNVGLATLLSGGERMFMFKEIPATPNYPANTLLGSDQILFEGRKWAQAPGRELWNDRVSHVSIMFCVEVRPGATT